jgi:hypothetical protein
MAFAARSITIRPAHPDRQRSFNFSKRELAERRAGRKLGCALEGLGRDELAASSISRCELQAALRTFAPLIANLEEDERDDFVRALRLRLSGRVGTTAWLRILAASKERHKS